MTSPSWLNAGQFSKFQSLNAFVWQRGALRRHSQRHRQRPSGSVRKRDLLTQMWQRMRLNVFLIVFVLIASSLADNPIAKVFRRFSNKKGPDGADCADPRDLARTKNQLKQAQDDKAKALQEKQATTQDLQDVQRQVDALRKESKKQTNDVSKAQKERDAALDEAKRLREESKQLKRDNRNTAQKTSDQTKQSNESTKKLTQELEKVQQRNQVLEQSVASLQAEKQTLEGRYKELEDTYKARPSDADIEARIQEELSVRLGPETRKLELELENKWKEDFERLKEANRVNLIEAQQQAEQRLEAAAASTRRDFEKAQAAHAAELHETMERLQTTSRQELEALKSSQEERMKKVQIAHEQETQDLRERLQAARVKTSALEKERLEALDTYYHLEVRYKEMKRDLSYWEDAFGARSLLNLTHIAEETSRFVRDIRSVFATALSPYTGHLTDAYDAKLKAHVDKAVQASKIEEAIEAVKGAVHRSYSSFFGALVKQHDALICPKVLLMLKQMDPVYTDVTERLLHCRQPEQAVRSFLTAIVVILMFCFSGTIVKFMSWPVLFVPRMIFGGRKDKASSNGSDASTNGSSDEA